MNHLDDDILSALVDGQLTSEERSEAEAHLGTCATCRQQLDGFRSVATLLRALPEVVPPREFTLGPRLLKDPPNVLRLRRWYTATRVVAAAFAAVFVFLSAGALYEDSRPVPVASTVAVDKPQLLASPAAARAVGAAAPAPARAPQPDDQVAAATSVNPLPTLAPTPVSLSAPAVVAQEPGATWRTAAAIFGVLAVLMLLGAVVARHRLHTFQTENTL